MLMEAAVNQMARRKRPKAVSVASGDVAVMEILNPFRERAPELKVTSVGEIVYREDRIVVARSLRDDPLGRLHDRSQISQAQYYAGREWQRLYEDAEVGRIGSIDTAKEPVDGTKRFPEPVTDRMQKAVKRIAELDRALGEAGAGLVRDVLGSRMFMPQVCQRRSQAPSKAMLEYYGRRFRECLTTLANELGFGC